jgi:hypothetical protein
MTVKGGLWTLFGIGENPTMEKNQRANHLRERPRFEGERGVSFAAADFSAVPPPAPKEKKMLVVVRPRIRALLRR